MAPLLLVVGSTKPFVVEVVGAGGSPEAFSGVDLASVTVREYAGAAAALLQRSVTAGTLTVTPGKLTGTLTGLEADALPPGLYVGQGAVRYGSADAWQFTEYFPVEIVRAVAAKV